MNHIKLSGLVAATYTPLNHDGSVNTAAVPAMVEHLICSGVTGLYVCGSTGEGMSLSGLDRRQVAEAYVAATAGRVPVIVQVGHNSLHEARELATHAQHVGADVISATCPSYFKVTTVNGLVDSMAEVASGAPKLPFYYYHIPTLTGSKIDMVEFLCQASLQIDNLVGLKYTDAAMHEFQECLELQDGRFDVVWGFDEMLLGALATGAQAAIGSTYNIAAPLYQKLINAFRKGDLTEARRLQSLSISMIRILCQYPFHPAMKAVLKIRGLDVGGCRLPQGSLTRDQTETLKASLTNIGFFDWSKPD